MSPHPSRRPRPSGLRLAAAVLVAAALAAGAVPAQASPRPTAPLAPAPEAPAASAALVRLVAPRAPEQPAPDPVVDPTAGSEELRAQVAALTAQVDELDVRAEIAFEDYNEVQAELDALIAQEVQAQVSLDDAGRALRSDKAHATRRIRALYRTGGTTEIAWTALATSGSGFAEAASGFQQARVVLDADAASVARAREQVDVAVTTSAEVQDVRRRRTELETVAAQRHRDAEAALASGRQLLAFSGTALAQAVERERAEAERVALERALAEAARAAEARAAAQALTLLPAGLSPEERAQALAQDSAGARGPGGGVVTAGTVGGDLQAVLDRAAAGASSPTAAAAIRAAGSRLGLPYTWGATGPGTFDCSGLTMWAYAQAGARLPRTSRQQYAGLPRVPVDQLLPGDLVFYADGSDPGSIHHVSIWLGDGLILTAPKTGDVVKISPVWRQPLYGAVRVPG